jgi:preprotein translocase subunit SecD
MNFCPMQQKWTMINKHNIIVLSAAFFISAAIWIIAFNRKKSGKEIPVSSKVFQGTYGWGYEILVNDTVYIHQDIIPSLPGKTGYLQKEQAEAAAQLVVNKLKSGQSPRVTTFEQQQIISSYKK